MCKTTGDQHPGGALRVSRIPPEQKTIFLRCSVYLLNTVGAKTRQVALREIPLSVEIQTLPEQLSQEHPFSKEQQNSRRSLILSCFLTEHPLVEIMLRNGAPAVYFHHTGTNCSAGNPPPRGNPGLSASGLTPF
jgi:hypothetical protein